MSAKYTFGQSLTDENQYHNNIVRNQLTRSLTTKFEDVCDEIALAMSELIPRPVKEGGMSLSLHAKTLLTFILPHSYEDWVAANGLATMRDVVCRASNRIFVGVPLCKEAPYFLPDWKLTLT